VSDTYRRVCVLERGHPGDHLPYHAAPPKDEFGNKDIAHPRCLHVVPVETEAGTRYRVVFELIDPMTPLAGWHEVANEHSELAEAESQLAGLRSLERNGDDVRNSRIEHATVKWELL
jgi:hypothetical protein